MSVPVSIQRHYTDLDDASMEEMVHVMVLARAVAAMAGFDNTFRLVLTLSDDELADLSQLHAVHPVCGNLELKLAAPAGGGGALPRANPDGLAAIRDVCRTLRVAPVAPRVADDLVASLAEALDVASLCIRGARFTTALPCLARLSNLTTLRITRCGLADVPPCIAALPHLERLVLKHNALTRLPAEMARSPVKHLCLNDNALECTAHLPNGLTSLKLKAGLAAASPAAGAACLECIMFKAALLRKLDISNNGLTTFPHFHQAHILMPVLRSLHMGGNAFTVLPHFAPTLEKLDASHNRLQWVHALPEGVAVVNLAHAVQDATMADAVLAGPRDALRRLLASVDVLPVCARAPNLQALDIDADVEAAPWPRMPHLEVLGVQRVPVDVPFACPALAVLAVRDDAAALPATLRLCRGLKKLAVQPSLRARADALLALGNDCDDVALHLEVWRSLATADVRDVPADLHDLVCTWSNRLMRCGEFYARPRDFATAVATILDATACPAFRAAFVAQVEANLGNCSDRAAAALNELYVAARLARLPDDPDTAAALLMRAAVTDCLNGAVARWCSQHATHRETAEVYLYAAQQMADVLPLLCVTTHMDHHEYTVTKLDVPDAVALLRAVLDAVPEAWVGALERHGVVDLTAPLAHFHDELAGLDAAGAGLDAYTALARRRRDAAFVHCMLRFPGARTLLYPIMQ